MKELIGHRDFCLSAPTNNALPLVVDVAATFWKRFRGLMLSDRLPDTQGLLITDCASVHTCFVRYALDVVYLDRHGVVVQLVPDLKPWRFSVGKVGTAYTLELAAGGIARYDIHVGDRLLERLENKNVKNIV